MFGKGYDGKQFQLVNKETGQPVEKGDTITSFRGDTEILDSGRPPHKPNGSGYANACYASVYGLKWVEV